MTTSRPFRLFLLLFISVSGAWLFLQPTPFTTALSTRQPPITAEILQGKPATPTIVDLQAIAQQSSGTGRKPDDSQSSPETLLSNPAGTLNIISSFKAIDHTQTMQGVPPNPALMVGSNHVVVSVNSSFQVFDKNGTSLLGPIQFMDFWGSSCGTGSATMVLSSPISAYDEQFGRYILGMMAFDAAINNGDNGYFCLAVSQTDSPAGQWYLYSFDGNPAPGADHKLDFPRLGVGQEAIYTGVALYDEISLAGNRAFAFEKSAMYSGTVANMVTADVSSSYFHLIPADMKGYNNGRWPADPDEPHYFIEAEAALGNELKVFAFQSPWETPVFSLAATLPVSSYNLTFDQPQSGTSHKIKGLDNRIVDVTYRNSRLWAVHTIGCNPGGGSVNCLRWYEINMSDPFAPAVVQEGTYSSPGTYRSFPAMTVNDCGDALIGYTKTSQALFPGSYVVGREAADSPGQLKSETTLHAGEDFYLAEDSTPHRWGYYTDTTIDPDGRTFWHIGLYSRLQPINRWSTWVGAFTWSGCEPLPTPTPTPSSTTTPTSSPTSSPTTTPSASPTASPSPTATTTGTPTGTPAITKTPTPTETLTPSQTPTGTPPPIVYWNWIPLIMK